MKNLIHLLKYRRKTVLRHFFADLIFAFIDTYHLDLTSFDYLIPVPLSPARSRERGFNQSELIGQIISSQTRVPLLLNTLLKSRHTQSQTVLGSKERWTNIQGTFKINPNTNLISKNICIVDDLLTTGATADEAARTLKQAGALRVDVLTLAIAV